MSCVICWCFVEFVTLREPTANQAAPCWGSARCRRCSSALCLRSSAASRSGWPALRTDCWKANTHQQVRLQSALSTSCRCFPPSSPCTVQQNLFLSPMSVKAHIQTEAYLESDVPETKAQWILNFRIWYKINICREKCHLIYNYRIFQFNLIFNVFIINDRQKKKKEKNLISHFLSPHACSYRISMGVSRTVPLARACKFLSTRVQVFSQRSQHPALQRCSEPKATHCINRKHQSCGLCWG